MKHSTKSYIIFVCGLVMAPLYSSCGNPSITSSEASKQASTEALNRDTENSSLNIRGGVNEPNRFQNVVSISSIVNVMCTGLVISPKHIVTSAMCAHPTLRLNIGFPTANNTGRYHIRTTFHPKFDYTSKTLQYDIALLEISNPLPQSFANTSLMDINALSSLLISRWLNAPAIAVGFGLFSDNLDSRGKPTWGVKRSGGVNLIGLKTMSGSKKADGSEVIVALPGASNQLGCYGDAGGPIFSESDTSVAMGILSSFTVSAGKGACGNQKGTYYVSFSNTQIRSWLRDELLKSNYVIDAKGRVVSK